MLKAKTTRLLIESRQGDDDALSALRPSVYEELRSVAAAHMRKERRGHTLQPTALVHEVYLRLINQEQVHLDDRNRFVALAAQ
jgi:RNA polymerase sigma-70 factor (ECF subfamily)